VVAVASSQQVDVERSAGMVAERLKEILRKLALKVIHPRAGQFHLVNKVRPPAQVAAYPREGFIHRHVCRPVSFDALFVAAGFVDRLAEADADVFHAVMKIDFNITFTDNGAVKEAMRGKKREHVVHKSVSASNFGKPFSVKDQFAGNVSFFRFSFNNGFPIHDKFLTFI
jgi:hypothetical protein